MATVGKTVLSFAISRKKSGFSDQINCLVLQVKFYWKKTTLKIQETPRVLPSLKYLLCHT